MSSTVGFAADAVPGIPVSGIAQAGDAPPTSRTEHDAWSPLVIATLWWGLVAYGCVRALLAW
jgi:hypothetical protein